MDDFMPAAAPDFIPVPPGGGSWRWDTTARAWQSADAAQAATPAVSPDSPQE